VLATARGLLSLPGMKKNPHTSHRPSTRALDAAALAGVTGGASAPRDSVSGNVISPRDSASGLPT
jgi:hypothetical protein